MRHRRMLAPINTVKHYIIIENTEVASATSRVQALVTAEIAPAVATTADVKEGSLVKAVFLELWVHSKAAAGLEVKFQFALEKVPTGAAGLTFVEMNNPQAYDNKKNILFYSQGVIGDLTTQGVPIVRQWFKIPKGKQRFGLGDRLLFNLAATGVVLDSCGFSTYKEYT